MACQKPKPKPNKKTRVLELNSECTHSISLANFFWSRAAQAKQTHTHLHMCNFFMYLSHLRYLNGLLTEAPEKIVN